YDARGSALFEEITERPEYYLTRTERSIFETRAGAIVAAARARATEPSLALELGAGTATKTQILLAALCRAQGRATFMPVDVSAEPLAACSARLRHELPEVRVEPVLASNEQGLARLADRREHRI